MTAGLSSPMMKLLMLQLTFMSVKINPAMIRLTSAITKVRPLKGLSIPANQDSRNNHAKVNNQSTPNSRSNLWLHTSVSRPWSTKTFKSSRKRRRYIWFLLKSSNRTNNSSNNKKVQIRKCSYSNRTIKWSSRSWALIIRTKRTKSLLFLFCPTSGHQITSSKWKKQRSQRMMETQKI